MLWFFLKVQFLISIFVWLRGTLPRLRYDQFMKLGWKGLIPISLAWIMVIAMACAALMQPRPGCRGRCSTS
jgi:NADH-quinone oxidoreductase subunit H